MRKSIYLFLAGLILSFTPINSYASEGKCQTEDPFPYVAPYDMDHCPNDIQSWLDRANTCAHFEGEEPYDQERKIEIEAVLNEHQCEYIACDFHDLFMQYEGDLVYTGVLVDYERVLTGEEGFAYCNMEQEMPPEERVGDEYLEEISPEAGEPQDHNEATESKGKMDSIFKEIFK